MAQGYPPRRSARPSASGRRGRAGEPVRSRPEHSSRPNFDEFENGSDEDLPPWAGLGIHPTGPGGRQLRPPRAPEPAQPRGGQAWPAEEPPDARGSRRAAAKARRSRRRLVVGVGLFVVAVAVVLGILGKLPFQGKPAAAPGSGLVTTLQPGEFRAVPNACDAISVTLLRQYLPGKLAKVSQSVGNSSQSQCTWTLDARPDFRVLTVSSAALTPSLLSSGDGSATFSAIDAYGQQLRGLQDPPKSSKAPKAQLGAAAGLGRDAFSALQVFHVGGVTTDEVTVVARDRNVLVDISMQGQEHGGGFGPVPVSTLRAAALAAAHEMIAGIH